MEKLRLDQLLVVRGLAATRSAARGLILAGLVKVDGSVVDKCGAMIPVTATTELKELPRYVSRGGDKLGYALSSLGIEVKGRRALDVGSSTGGFVDCLLQSGAEHVIALDVGRGQLDQRLREDSRVTVLEGVNARYLRASSLPYSPDLVTMDVSFISVRKVLPAVCACATPVFDLLVLVKPQFEAGPRRVGKGGIVRDPAVRKEVVLEVARFIAFELGLVVRGVCDSGLPGAAGNREYFIWAHRGGDLSVSSGEHAEMLDTLADMVDAAMAGEP